MKLVDKFIDYVANRVLDRMQERTPTFTVNNVARIADRNISYGVEAGKLMHDAMQHPGRTA